MESPKHRTTRVLRRLTDGDQEAASELLPMVYDELRRLAGAAMEGRGAQTLQPTALVHEAYLKLIDQESPWEGRSHFLGVAAKAMRSILVDHARARSAAKRGGGRPRVPLDDALGWYEEQSIDLVALDDALAELGREDERLARVVELRFFGGLENAEIADVLGVSTPTVVRDWRLARAWLHRAMSEDE